MVSLKASQIITYLLLLGENVTGKDQYMVTEKQESDHAMVRASTSQCKYCFFDDASNSYTASGNQFCLTMDGYLRLGYEVEQESQPILVSSNQGYNKSSLKIYLSQYLTMEPNFTLSRLFANTMSIQMPNWNISWDTSIGYHWVEHRFCIDVALLMDEDNSLAISITQNQQFIECSKTLIGYLLDFGQYAPFDTNSDSKQYKPYGPYAKLLEKCSLGGGGSWEVKNYQPLYGNPLQKQYFVGTGSFDYGCFPGNVMLWLIDFDHNLTLGFRYMNWYTPNFINWVGYLRTNTIWPGQAIASAGHGKKSQQNQKPQKMIQGSEGLNNYVINYLQPWADVFFGNLVQTFGQVGRADGKKTTIVEAAFGGAEIPKDD